MTTTRVLIALPMQNWTISLMAEKNAIRHGYLKELTYMKPPPNYYINRPLVCKLKKSLYGSKQAPRAWFE